MNWIKSIGCFFGHHKRKPWSKELCEREKVMWGIMAPWECSHCGHKSQVFKYPKFDFKYPKPDESS